jgi:alkaline phosphatase
LDYTIDRNLEQPTLAQMVAKAIDLLEGSSPNGFFLMIEGSRIDHAGHDNGTSSRTDPIFPFPFSTSFFASHTGATRVSSRCCDPLS